jgi:hypothetical protein
MATATAKCAACGRDCGNGKAHCHCYCSRHAKAFEQLQAHYAAWVRAYGHISWDEYLSRLSKMKETGDLVKQVIEAENQVKRRGKKT